MKAPTAQRRAAPPRRPVDAPALSCVKAARIALDIVDRAGREPGELIAVAESRLAHRHGPRPALSVRGLLATLLLNALLGREMHLTQVRDQIAQHAPDRVRAEFGLGRRDTRNARDRRRLTYAQLERAVSNFVAAFRDPAHDHPEADPVTGEVLGCPEDCPARHGLQYVVSALVAASVATDVPLSPHCALDSTDVESWASRLSWGKAADVDPDSLEAVTKDIDVEAPMTVTVGEDDTAEGDEKKVTVRTTTRADLAAAHARWADGPGTPRDPASRRPPRNGPTVTGKTVKSFRSGFPQAGPDGRLLHSVAADVTEGYRSGTNGGSGGTFLGLDAHLLDSAPSLWDAEATCHQFLALVWAPAGSHKGHAGTLAVTEALAFGAVVGTLRDDRGYTVPLPDTFLYPVRAMGVVLVHDLHPHQRGVKGLVDGAKVVDGWLFTDALPEDQVVLEQPGINTTAAEKETVAATYDKRAAYAFRTNGAVDADGYRQLVGPAYRGHVRCANNPESLRGERSVPKTTCVEGVPCRCSAIVTVGPDTFRGLEQPNLFGTTAWRRDYYRRVQVENGNSILKSYLDVDRGTVRCIDQDDAALLHTFVVCAANVLMARSFRVSNGYPDPDGCDFDEDLPLTGPVAPGPVFQHAVERAVGTSKKRRKRRTRTLQGLASDP